MLIKEELEKLYKNGLSMKEISDKTGWSYHQVTYWMNKHDIPRRSWSDATYIKRNPNGDPFKIKKNLNKKEIMLKGLGLGIFWGEGFKRTKYGVRVGNTDSKLIKKFIEFLDKIYGIKKDKLKFGLQIFDDLDQEKSLNFWTRELNIKPFQFYKLIITPRRGKGTYKRKLPHGVLTLYFNNIKLKQTIDKMIENL